MKSSLLLNPSWSVKSVARFLQGTRPMLPLLLLVSLGADKPAHSAELVFPLHKKHNHARQNMAICDADAGGV